MKLSGTLQEPNHGHIVFTFKGDEDPSRILAVEAVARNRQGRAIARAAETFRDPRIAAKKPQPGGLLLDPTANITLSLPKGVFFSEIGSIDLYVKEGRSDKFEVETSDP